MVDLIRRDVDIIANESGENTEELLTENGRPLAIEIVEENVQQILSTIKKTDGPNIIFTSSSHPNNDNSIINIGNKKIIFANHLEVLSRTGHQHKINIPKRNM